MTRYSCKSKRIFLKSPGIPFSSCMIICLGAPAAGDESGYNVTLFYWTDNIFVFTLNPSI